MSPSLKLPIFSMYHLFPVPRFKLWCLVWSFVYCNLSILFQVNDYNIQYRLHLNTHLDYLHLYFISFSILHFYILEFMYIYMYITLYIGICTYIDFWALEYLLISLYQMLGPEILHFSLYWLLGPGISTFQPVMIAGPWHSYLSVCIKFCAQEFLLLSMY